MNDIPNLALSQAAPSGMTEALRRRPVTLRNIIATWRRRIRFRWELERMSKDNPHLIGDIGLTNEQAEAEIAKRFWQG